MRGVIAFFMVIALGGLGIHGYSGESDGGPAERVIRAEPSEIVEAMNRSLRSDGMEVVSRSDSGDYYRLALTAEEMRQHPKYERLAEQGDLTFNAHVTSRQIEFTANFESGLVAGFNDRDDSGLRTAAARWRGSTRCCATADARRTRPCTPHCSAISAVMAGRHSKRSPTSRSATVRSRCSSRRRRAGQKPRNFKGCRDANRSSTLRIVSLRAFRRATRSSPADT